MEREIQGMPGSTPKKKVKRQTFMGEKCTNEGCYRKFKVEKDYDEYRLHCPYCGKKVKSTRILIAKFKKDAP